MTGNGVFTIDGMDFRVFVISLERSFAVTDNENSGRVQSARMYRDIVGTFYNYKMEIEPHKNYRADYDSFYQIITSPTESHRLIFPYGQTTLEFEAYVTNGTDNLKKRIENEWSGLTVNFVAMEPQRR